jgi:NAD-dependent dihydropyrimidine dehydrogenase PreA subunit
MSEKWYPVINYEKCTECGNCVEMCAHGVYNKTKAPRPVVIYPEGCIEGCTGCGSKCKNNAIEYFDARIKGNKPACNCG